MISKLIGHANGVLVQGITGRQGQLETRWMLDSGVHISAGVTPGRGGQEIHGVPVYDSVAEAVEAHGNVASMIYAPPAVAPAAAQEAVESGVQLAVISAEDVPVYGMVRAIEAAERHGARIVGPNSQGLVAPGVGRIGCPGGVDPHERFRPGPIAVVSRSGGMTSEIAFLARQWGWGTSVHLHLGGATVPGTTVTEAIGLAQREPGTKVTVVFGEPAGGQEEAAATALADGRLEKPIIALVAGLFADSFPSALPFGHAPRAGGGDVSSVRRKLEAFEAAGASVASSLKELRMLLEEHLGLPPNATATSER